MNETQVIERFERFRKEHPEKPYIFDVLDNDILICVCDKAYLESDKVKPNIRGVFKITQDYGIYTQPRPPTFDPFTMKFV